MIVNNLFYRPIGSFTPDKKYKEIVDSTRNPGTNCSKKYPFCPFVLNLSKIETVQNEQRIKNFITNNLWK